MEKILTNDHIRNWSLGEVNSTLGNRCSGNGSLYTFFKDGALEQRKCIDGKFVFRQFNWQLTSLDDQHPGEWQLVFSEPLVVNDYDTIRVVRIDFPLGAVGKSKQIMKWRSMPVSHLRTEIRITLKSVD